MVARTLSFTQAAKHLRYAQSTVTAQIKGLEADLRVALFDRRGGRVRLTTSGERLLPYAERMLSLSEEARRIVRHDGAMLGKLVVGAGEVITTYHLPGLIESFHHRHPDVYLSLQNSSQDGDRAAEPVDLGDADVVLLHDTRGATDGPRRRMIGYEPLALVAEAGHPLERLPVVAPQDLGRVRSIITSAHCVYARLYDAELGRHGIRPSAQMEFGTVEAVKRAVASGLGVALLPRVAVQDSLTEGELTLLPWQPSTPLRTFAIWPESEDGSAVVQAFVSLVVGEFGAMATADVAPTEGGGPGRTDR